MKAWQEKLVTYGTFLLVFLTPIVYFGANWFFSYSTSKTFFFYGLTEIIFAVWIYEAFVDQTLRLSRKNLLILLPFFAYVAWLTVAGIFGADPGFSFWSSLSRGTGLLTLYHALALVLVICSLVGKHGLKKYGYKLMGWFIGGASILAISVWLGNEGFNLPFQILLKSKGGGLMGNSSLTATVLVFAVFFEIFLLFAKDVEKKFKIFLGIALALIIFSPLFINVFGNSLSARGALAGMLAGAMAMVPFYLFLSKKKITKIVGAILIFSGVLASIFIWQSLMKPGTTIHEKFAESATESRFIFWNIARTAMRESPMIGYGPENYRVANQIHFDPKIYTLGDSVEVWNDRAHNIIFDTGVAGGYPAIVLYFCFLGSLLFGIYKANKKGRITRAQGATLGALIIAYFFQNLFVFDSLVSLMSLGILAGVIFGMSEEIKEVKKNNNSSGTNYILVPTILVITVVAWIFFVYLPVRKTVAISNIIEMPLNKRPDHYKDLLTGSSVGNAFEVGSIAEDSYNLYSDNQKEIKSDEKLLKYSLLDIQKFTQYLEEVRKREPNDYRLRLNLARLYNIEVYLTGEASRTDQALSVEDEALALSPTDPEIYWTKAITLYRSGDVPGAKEVLQKAIEIAPYIGFSKELLDQFSK